MFNGNWSGDVAMFGALSWKETERQEKLIKATEASCHIPRLKAVGDKISPAIKKAKRR